MSFSFTYICTSVWHTIKIFPFMFERLFSDIRSSFNSYPLTPSLKLSSLEDLKPFVLTEPKRHWTLQTYCSDGMVSVRMSTRRCLRDTSLLLSLLLNEYIYTDFRLVIYPDYLRQYNPSSF